jgi:hypothetical protein
MGYKITWEKIFKEFVSRAFIRKDAVVDWYPSGQLEVTVKMEDGSRFRYDYLSKTSSLVKLAEGVSGRDITEEEWRAEFGYRLARRMRLKAISQVDLAEEADISVVTLSRYLNGRATPTGYALFRLAMALGCSMSELSPGVDLM